MYLDDLLIRGASRQECAAHFAKAMSILKALGIPANEKAVAPRSLSEGIVFLGVLIKTSDCSLTVTDEHKHYAVDRLDSLVSKGTASLKELESVSGVLSWIAQVFIPGRPRRNSLFEAIHRLKERNANATDIRGELRRQLQWWRHALCNDNIRASSHVWTSQPITPLMCSDASGEDGWGACACGVRVVGNWPDEWKQSAGADAPSMLFKELVPSVITVLLLAARCENQVFAAATDNAGVAFVLNSLSCRCPRSMALLRPLADALARHHLGLIVGHAHRECNAHADELSHALTTATMWNDVCEQALHRKPGRMEFQFIVHDTIKSECFAASMSFPRVSSSAVPGAP